MIFKAFCFCPMNNSKVFVHGHLNSIARFVHSFFMRFDRFFYLNVYVGNEEKNSLGGKSLSGNFLIFV